MKKPRKESPLTIQQALSFVEELYLHSLRKDPRKVNQAYAEWFMDMREDAGEGMRSAKNKT